jgi:hypothetical protein
MIVGWGCIHYLLLVMVWFFFFLSFVKFSILILFTYLEEKTYLYFFKYNTLNVYQKKPIIPP